MKLIWGPVDCGHGVVLDTSLTDHERDELQRLANGARVLEVGSCFDYSALQMALVAKHVFAVDPHMEEICGIPGSLPAMRNALRVFGVEERVTICLSYSQDALPALKNCGAQFDLVFIDGDHHAPVVRHDMDLALHLTRRGGAIAIHDYADGEWPDVQTVLDEHFPPPTRIIDSLWVLDR